MNRVARFVSITALGAAAGLVGCSSSPADDDPTPASEAADSTHEATMFKTGDLVERDGVSAIAPPPGTSVYGIFRKIDGEKRIQVSTDLGGHVWIERRPDTTGDTVECTSPAECTDTKYVLEPWQWTSSFHYYFNAGSTPSYLFWADVSNDIVKATTNIIQPPNNCHRADGVSATYVYEGTTTRWANITSNASCAANDGYSVTSFGTQPLAYLASTCVWTIGTTGVAYESDTVINNTGYTWFTGAVPTGCSNKYSIDDVMTHERGHTYGLNHPGSCHANLTMYQGEVACSLRNTTLGLGDMLGLEWLY